MPAKPAIGVPADLADVALADISDCRAVARAGDSWIYQAVKEQRFPAPVIREHRFTRWLRSDLRQWAIERAAQPLGEGAAKNDARAKKASAQARENRARRAAA